MHYMLCKNRVEDFDRWRRVFDSHADAHRDAGLNLLHLLRDNTDPNMVVFLFRVDDLDRAQAFIQAPAASDAADTSGVIGKAEISILTD